ncbi:MAG: glycosyltransferase [Sphingomonas sp.]
MRVVYFSHSLRSCWNHGNAHFLRGVLSELIARGHDVRVLEPEGAWSLTNLLKDHGEKGLSAFRSAYPELTSRTYQRAEEGAAHAWGADLVIVHEWNDPELVAAVGRLRARGGRFTLLFHDTHHRAVSAAHEMRDYDLSAYDGILAFGQALASVYERWGWSQVFVWHEAADTRRFHPPREERAREGLVWIGNWGDGERSAELIEFLIHPAKQAGIPLDIYGVRYPNAAQQMLQQFGARYHGWLPNAATPAAFARHLATVHVPRRFYARSLPGIPTIRVFEALACGIPLISAPWDDCEHLFRVDQDFLMVRDGVEMARALNDVKSDPDLRDMLARNGLETIQARHTCAHRTDELLRIAERLRAPVLERVLESAA